jgi:lambda repressor-like predicted transcriptional regulator
LASYLLTVAVHAGDHRAADEHTFFFPGGELKRDWKQFHPLDRAKAISRIRESGVSMRQIAKHVGRSEALIRHLLKALKAPAAYLIAARQKKLSTNELVRRAKVRRLRRESESREAAEARRIESAHRAANLICNWLAGESIYGRAEKGSSIMSGVNTPAGHSTAVCLHKRPKT